MTKEKLFFLMGPTASGKTPLAIQLVQQFPFEIISVDSAMVYRGMDIGTAKPSKDILQIAPHRLIDMLDPSEHYSAGQFHHDVLREIKAIHAIGRVPLLVGGTMLYFRILETGIANMPKANAAMRALLQQEMAEKGIEALHAELQMIDLDAATRIHPKDVQRIQRALEVYRISGKTITAWQKDNTHPLADYHIHHLALAPNDRAVLHKRIAARFDAMLADGFQAEVEKLYARSDLHADLPAIRSVGYRQMWEYLSQTLTYDAMREAAICATRQLAKRQLTWLRSFPALHWFDSESAHVMDAVSAWLCHKIKS